MAADGREDAGMEQMEDMGYNKQTSRWVQNNQNMFQ